MGAVRQLKKEASAIDKADPVTVAIVRGADHLARTMEGNRPNADAVRALILAAAAGYNVSVNLDQAIAYLKQPAQWPREGRVALGYALAAAERHGRAASTDLAAAAKLLLADQQADGSFGSPIETWRARMTLIESGMQPDEVWIIQIDRWVRGLTVDTVADMAAVLLAIDLAGDVMAEDLRRNYLGRLRGAQSPSGGWGAAAEARPQILETSLAVLALKVLDAEPRMARSSFRPEELKAAIAAGRRYLVSQQAADGGWAGIAPTAWAIQALLP